MMAMEQPLTGRCLWGPRLFYCVGQVNCPGIKVLRPCAKRLTARSAVPPEWAEVSSMAGKSPEPLKETPDFGGLLGQRGGDDGHGVDLLGVAAAGEVVDRGV